jgi:hypothetical protein
MTDDERSFYDFAARQIEWQRTDRDDYPFEATVDGEKWLIRLNDYPDQPLYALLVDGEEKALFDDWPLTWRRPEF